MLFAMRFAPQFTMCQAASLDLENLRGAAMAPRLHHNPKTPYSG